MPGVFHNNIAIARLKQSLALDHNSINTECLIFIQGEQLCSYSYSAEQHYQDDEENPQKTQVNATVDITCTSSMYYYNC